MLHQNWCFVHISRARLLNTRIIRPPLGRCPPRDLETRSRVLAQLTIVNPRQGKEPERKRDAGKRRRCGPESRNLSQSTYLMGSVYLVARSSLERGETNERPKINARLSGRRTIFPWATARTWTNVRAAQKEKKKDRYSLQSISIPSLRSASGGVPFPRNRANRHDVYICTVF